MKQLQRRYYVFDGLACHRKAVAIEMFEQKK